MSSKSDRTSTNRFPMPKTTEEVLGTLRALIDQGSVTRLELLFDEGLIREVRKVENEDLLEEEVSWEAALRNVPDMEEYFSEGAESFQFVVDMMHLIRHYGCHPVQWVTGAGGTDLIDKWLELKERGMPKGNGYLMGIPITELQQLPDETLILCGSKYPSAGPEEIEFAVKTVIDLENKDVQSGETDDRRGNGSGQRAGAVGTLEAASGGLCFPRWSFRGGVRLP